MLTREEMVAAFAEWDRQFREDPDRFQSTVKRILSGETVETYGENATRTFLAMHGDVLAR